MASWYRALGLWSGGRNLRLEKTATPPNIGPRFNAWSWGQKNGRVMWHADLIKAGASVWRLECTNATSNVVWETHFCRVLSPQTHGP